MATSLSRRRKYRTSWQEAVRTQIVARGIQAMFGASDPLANSVADDIPLVRAGVRLASLRVLGALGIERIVARSGLGYQFVCHIGDLAEYPFYHRRALETELLLCAAWLEQEYRPIIYDVGANVGFFSTQLVQMLSTQASEIYAFEAVPTTFVKLVQSVRRLGLELRIHPIAAAVLDVARPVCMSFSDQNSLLSQVGSRTIDTNCRSGLRHSHAAGITLDDFYASTGHLPALVKIDVEGSEVATLRGSQRLFSEPTPPALMFEYHPGRILECDSAASQLDELLSRYRLYYVNDLVNQGPTFGTAIRSAVDLQWICNLFATALCDRWEMVCGKMRRLQQKRPGAQAKIRGPGR